MDEFKIEVVQSGPWWWRQTLYFIATDHGRFGPCDSREAAERDLAFLQSFDSPHKTAERP